MNGRGWSAKGLPVRGDDPKEWTVAEAAVHLGPPHLSVAEVRQLARIAGIQPVGRRRTSTSGSGRYARVYRAVDFIKAYDALANRSA